MQISVENVSNLGRRITIAVPSQQVADEYQKRIQRLAATKVVRGFRPGKAPVRVIERQEGERVRGEVVEDLMRSSFYDAIAQAKLRLAGVPQFEPQQVGPDQDLAYAATFEVYPEIHLASFEGANIEKLTANLQEADVDATLDQLRQRRKEWEPVERPAMEGDKLVIDFVGLMGGEPFPGGTAKDFSVELGTGEMIPGFESGLVGAEPGQTRVLNLQFPKEYSHTDLADKPVQFNITVKVVLAAKLPELDETFARQFGLTNVDELRAEVRKNMNAQLEKTLRDKLKKQVMDKFLALNVIEIPTALIAYECNYLRDDALSRLGKDMVGKIKKTQVPLEIFEAEARRRVHLSLLFNEIIKQRQLKADKDSVRSKIEEMAASYQEPEKMVDWFYGNEKQLSSIEALVLEEQVVDGLLKQAQVTEKEVSYSELMQDQGE